MAGAIVKKAFEIADSTALKLGFDVVDIEYVKEGADKFLRIYIDSPDGVGLDECEKFSRAFETEFDGLDIIDEAYILEISSPGVERVLKTEREFLHYTGREVSVKLYKASDGKKEFNAVLSGYEKPNVFLKTEDGEIKIPQSECVYIKLFCSF